MIHNDKTYDSKQEGRLERIWLKRFVRGPMDERQEVTLLEGVGLEGSVNQAGKRHITLMEVEVWQWLMEQLGTELSFSLSPSERRANVLVSNFSLAQSRGKIIKIGDTRLRVYGETKPCERMDEVHKGLKDLMFPNWRGGAFAEVLRGGSIAVGDKLSWQEDSTTSQ